MNQQTLAMISEVCGALTSSALGEARDQDPTEALSAVLGATLQGILQHVDCSLPDLLALVEELYGTLTEVQGDAP